MLCVSIGVALLYVASSFCAHFHLWLNHVVMDIRLSFLRSGQVRVFNVHIQSMLL